MEPVYENLVALQDVDLRIHALEQSKIDFPHKVLDLTTLIKTADTERDSAQKKLDDTIAEQKAISDKIAEYTSLLEKSQSRLNSIKTNREYDAIHAEIENAKSGTVSQNIKLKQVCAEVERSTLTVAHLTEKATAVRAENEPLIAELTEKIATIDSQIASIMQERDSIAPKIPRPYLSQYDFIRSRRKTGRALSPVSESRTCGVCFKILESYVINEIKTGRKLVNCQSCGSLLVWQPNVV